MSTMRQLSQSADPGAAPGVTTTILVLAIIIGSVLLTWVGKINGDAFVALTSGIVGGVLVARGVASGSQASSGPTPTNDDDR